VRHEERHLSPSQVSDINLTFKSVDFFWGGEEEEGGVGTQHFLVGFVGIYTTGRLALEASDRKFH